MKPPLQMIRRAFISGLVTAIPLGITIFALQFIFRFLDGITGKYFRNILTIYIPGLGIITSLLIILLLGLIINNVLGKRVMDWVERRVFRLPVLGSIYNVSKQVVSLFQKSEDEQFKKVVFIEYPRMGVWTLGFVTAKTQSLDAVELYNIFIPTTPNPTSGYMIFIPRKDVIDSHYSVEDGMKLLISGGLVSPATLHFTVNPKLNSQIQDSRINHENN